MLKIPCPYCGERSEIEFSYGGELLIDYPKDPSLLTDKQWAYYLYARKNIKGPQSERWCHSQGCRQWFVVERDTVTYQILSVLKSSPENDAK